MMPRLLLMMWSFIILFIVGPVQSMIIEDFEDGNFTSNPAWFGDTSFYSVVTDPVNPLNKVLRGTGLATEHHELGVFFGSSVPWNSFRFSIELMSTVTPPSDHGKIYIEFGDTGSTTSYSYHQQYDSGRIWEKLVGRTTVPKPDADIFEDIDQLNPNQWYRLTIWHDVVNNPDQINVMWELLATNQVLFLGTSDKIGPLSGPNGISWVQVWTEETTPYYYDNIIIDTISVAAQAITPEPSSIVLLTMVLAVCSGRPRRNRGRQGLFAANMGHNHRIIRGD